MSKNKSNKLKNSLSHVIRKLFEQNQESILNHKQVCTLIDIRENALRKLVFDILQSLAQEGFLKKEGHSMYGLKKDDAYIEGIIELTARGAGFVISETSDEDVFIAPKNIGQALNGDLVKIRVFSKNKKRLEGEVIDVLNREKTQFVGTIEMHDKFAFLVPDNQKTGTDIYIPKEKLFGAQNGEKALAKITVWPKSSKNPYGEIVEVLGKPGSNDIEMISILCNQGIDYKFPQEVLEQAETIPTSIDSKEINLRRDYRNTTTFTIDPIDAKDFDDALSIEKLDNGHYEIGVHIADVSHFVRPGTPMDNEALKRSNSVYLVDRVVPMLPEQLSNVLCSLRPNEDKYAFSAVFEMDDHGKIYKQWYGKTLIHSNHRFTYEAAQEIIEGNEGPFQNEIITLDSIAKILRKERLNSGALNIESEEMRFKLDDKGHPIDVIVKTSKDAHKLIEEFMLLANKHVAMFIAKPKNNREKIPFIFRIHDKPDIEKVATFNVFLEKFGYTIDLSKPEKIAKNINKLLEDIRFKNEYSLIQTMAIRSMAKASYDTDNIGHYGLAFSYYTHFTSPIRRYADLVVHRILFEELQHHKHRYGKELNEVCKHISKMERKAVEAERESTKFFQTIYVQDHIGQTFNGTVSGIAEFGLFVKMDDNYCEGMVPMQNLTGDRYYFDADKYRIIGARHKEEYNFGDKVRVRIAEVYPRKRQIDLEMIGKI